MEQQPTKKKDVKNDNISQPNLYWVRSPLAVSFLTMLEVMKKRLEMMEEYGNLMQVTTLAQGQAIESAAHHATEAGYAAKQEMQANANESFASLGSSVASGFGSFCWGGSSKESHKNAATLDRLKEHDNQVANGSGAVVGDGTGITGRNGLTSPQVMQELRSKSTYDVALRPDNQPKLKLFDKKGKALPLEKVEVTVGGRYVKLKDMLDEATPGERLEIREAISSKAKDYHRQENTSALNRQARLQLWNSVFQAGQQGATGAFRMASGDAAADKGIEQALQTLADGVKTFASNAYQTQAKAFNDNIDDVKQSFHAIEALRVGSSAG